MSKIKPQDKPHYVNNAQFSQAIVDYVSVLNEAKKTQEPLPKVPDYVAMCFLKICEGLSHKSNFVRYSYRDEMVMDAVENCLKAVENYNIEAATRTGNPNAFAYFTQISWYAFLRRIAKEKRQQDIKLKYMTSSGVEEFIMIGPDGDMGGATAASNFVDQLKERIDKVRESDTAVKEIVKKERKKRKKTVKPADSDLSGFLE